MAAAGNATMAAGLRATAKAMDHPPEPTVNAPVLDPTPQFYSVEDEVRYYRERGHRTMKRYIASPALLLQVVRYNAWAFWLQGRAKKATRLNFLVPASFLALALADAAIGFRREIAVLPILICILVFYLPRLVLVSVARYYVPLVPLLAILVALTLEAGLRRLWAAPWASRLRGKHLGDPMHAG